jgi:hypothetical protein
MIPATSDIATRIARLRGFVGQRKRCGATVAHGNSVR